MDAVTMRAFDALLEHPLDRQVVMTLLGRGEVRYEALRKAVGEPGKQTFKDAFDRLSRSAVVKRRLEEHGERYWSFVSLTTRGTHFAHALDGLRREGQIPTSIPAAVRDSIRMSFGAAVE